MTTKNQISTHAEAYPLKKSRKFKKKTHKLINQLLILHGKNYKFSHKDVIFMRNLQTLRTATFEWKISLLRKRLTKTLVKVYNHARPYVVMYHVVVYVLLTIMVQ